jgi:type I restriction enzyme, R subunit
VSSGPEWEFVEKPLLAQLTSLGWSILNWSDAQPSDNVERSSNRAVLLEERLRTAMRACNLDAGGKSWLDGPRLDAAIAELRSMPAGSKLLEANRKSTELLLGGTTVEGIEGWDGGRNQAVNFIDWDHPTENDFLAVSQFPVATPGQQADIRPDVVLFVNGIPLVVIEAKAAGKPMDQAIEQLRRYANQRDTATPEGSEQLFWTNQFTVGTTFEQARVGTFTSLAEHYLAWKDPHPLTLDQLAEQQGKPVQHLSQQEILVAGMLAPERLLDIVRHFTLFQQIETGTTVKVVARYQQYRGVHKAMTRMLTGKTKTQDGEVDRRGGIIWHTQGSGKSLTMVFLIRAMRSHRELRRFKIVLVTDRKDLQSQLGATAELTSQRVDVGKNSQQVKELIATPGPGIVMAMIQKYRDKTDNTDVQTDTGVSGSEAFGLLNSSEDILVMVDEAHRSHTNTAHAMLMASMPNAARLGFTGTPIIMGNHKKTESIFGGFLDKYTLRESEADGSTVPILYEGKTTDTALKMASKMDDVFLRWFGRLSDEQRKTLQSKYATSAQVLEAPELIRWKSEDLIRHYVSTVMPGGFKAILVATSREACIRYHTALHTARDEFVAIVEDEGPGLVVRITNSAVLNPEEQLIADAFSRLDLIRALTFEPVISGAQNDPSSYNEWSEPEQQKTRIERFKKRLGVPSEKHDPLAIVIVKSMLLTGFDAPQAQVLYLDRLIQEAELLQAIARVNRTASKKDYGLVVDYYGVSSQLSLALKAYAGEQGQLDPDVDGALRPLTTEIEKLAPQCERVRQIFVQRGIEPIADPLVIEACVQLLEDERLRAEFDVALGKLLDTYDTVSPRPAILTVVDDVVLFAEIQISARRRYRDTVDGDFDPRVYKDKVRKLIDDHITVLDLTQKIPAVKITDPGFLAAVGQAPSTRAKASEMEHALRHHIRQHLDEDPVHFTKLSEKLDEILQRLKDNFEQMVLEFSALINAENDGRKDEANTGLAPTELPFHGLLAEAVSTSDSSAASTLVELTRALVRSIRSQLAIVGFWENATKQDEMRKSVKVQLDDSHLFEYATLDELSVNVVDVAKANQRKLT